MARTVPRTSIFDIPNEVLTDIIGRVVESEPINLVASHLTCKRFLVAGETKDVYLGVALDYFHHKSFGKNKFVEKCYQVENPAAIFWKGMILYFNIGDKDIVVNHLRMAKDKGHLSAVYAMGMIKISEGIQASIEGFDLLNAFYDSVGDIWMFAQISGVVHSVLHNIVPHAIDFSILD